MVGRSLSAAQLGSSKLVCSSPVQVKHRRGLERNITADELLAHGPPGGPANPKTLRYNQIVAGRTRLLNAAAAAEEQTSFLHHVITTEAKRDTSAAALAHAHGRLARVVLDKVRHRFIEASLARPNSQLRSSRVKKFGLELATARNRLGSRGTPILKEEFRLLDVDNAALQAMERAYQLRKEAHALALQLPTSRSSRSVSSPDSSLTIASPSLGTTTVPSDSHLFAKDTLDGGPFTTEAELELMRERGRIVGETMEMLKEWKSHSEVAHSLCDALLAMAEKGGTSFREEMDRRGLGVLASTVASMWKGRSEVLRCALRLLSTLSLQSLLNVVEEQNNHELCVLLGLEVLNKRAKDDPFAIDIIVRCGGREVLDIVEPIWQSHKMISLHAVTLRRRLRRSRAKSERPRREVKLPPDEVVRLRGCWESVDAEDIGYITAEQLGQCLQMLGMKLTEAELAEFMDEVDVDGSGTVSWPEFLFLMSKFGANQSIESQFSDQRLAELREVFSLFDVDGNGQLDSKELGMVMRAVGFHLGENEIKAMINTVDADGSGCIEWPEFLFLMSKKAPDVENQHLLAFEFFDRESKGRIQREDFVASMKKLTDEFTSEELEEMVVQAKFEDDDYSSISYKEFVKMMMRC